MRGVLFYRTRFIPVLGTAKSFQVSRASTATELGKIFEMTDREVAFMLINLFDPLVAMHHKVCVSASEDG
jgi:hypothetical protein